MTTSALRNAEIIVSASRVCNIPGVERTTTTSTAKHARTQLAKYMRTLSRISACLQPEDTLEQLTLRRFLVNGRYVFTQSIHDPATTCHPVSIRFISAVKQHTKASSQRTCNSSQPGLSLACKTLTSSWRPESSSTTCCKSCY